MRFVIGRILILLAFCWLLAILYMVAYNTDTAAHWNSWHEHRSYCL